MLGKPTVGQPVYVNLRTVMKPGVVVGPTDYDRFWQVDTEEFGVRVVNVDDMTTVGCAFTRTCPNTATAELDGVPVCAQCKSLIDSYTPPPALTPDEATCNCSNPYCQV